MTTSCRYWMPVLSYQGHCALPSWHLHWTASGFAFQGSFGSAFAEALRGGGHQAANIPLHEQKGALTAFRAQVPVTPGQHFSSPAPGSPRPWRHGFPPHGSGSYQHIAHTRIKHKKCLQCLILQPSSRAHSWSDSSHPWKETCRNILDSPHWPPGSRCPLCCATPCAAVSPTLPPPNIPLKAKLVARTKNCTCKSWGVLLWKTKSPKHIWTHEQSSQTSS